MQVSCPLLLAAFASTASLSAAQSATALVLEGDNIAGVGNVTSISTLAVNSAGSWRVEVDTDNPNTDADGALIADGATLLVENQSLGGSLLLDNFDAINVNLSGDSGWNFFLDGTTGSSDDSGIFFNSTLILQEGAVSTASGFSAGTAYRGFFETKFNDAGDILVMASVDDPAIASPTDRALVVMTVSGGALGSETVLYKEGDILPGQTEALDDFETGPHNFDYNNSGQVLFIADLAGSTATDGAIYLDSTLLAQEGSSAPVSGRNWSNLSGAELSLNNQGQWVFSGSLDGDAATNLLIVKDGAKFRQEGDTLAAISPFTLTSFGSGPVEIADNGDVLWYGDWNDTDTSQDTGLFVNDELLVQEGVTSINGMTVTTLRGITDGYTMSPNGQFVVFEAILNGATEGAFVIDRGGFQPIFACVPNAGSLAHTDGGAGLGDTFTLSFDGGQGASAFSVLAVATAPAPGFPPCGLTTGFGEVLIGVLPPNPIDIFVGSVWTPTNLGTVSQTLPTDVSFIGQSFWTQGALFNPAFPAEKIRLTNGLVLDIGF